jgi:hypothetical protein
MGACCDYPWSGWTDCCSENNERKRLRWRGFNQYNSEECNAAGKYEEIIEPCGDYQASRTDLDNCSIHRPLTGQYKSTTYEYDYSVIYDGTYSTNNGFRYEVLNGRWFKLTPFGGRMEVSVDTAISQLDHAYIYKIGGVWYKFNNGRLYQTVNTQETPRFSNSNYSYKYAQSGTYTIGSNRYEIFMNDDKPVWSIFNQDGTSSVFEVTDKYYQYEWYYNFNDIWYKYKNGVFESIMILPWEIENAVSITETAPVTYTVIDAAGSGITSGVTYVNDNDITTTFVGTDNNNIARTSTYLPNNTRFNYFG